MKDFTVNLSEMLFWQDTYKKMHISCTKSRWIAGKGQLEPIVVS